MASASPWRMRMAQLQYGIPIRFRELGRVKGHGARVRSVAFNGDGTRLLTSSADGTAKIWNVLTQEEILALVGHEDRVRDGCFQPR